MKADEAASQQDDEKQGRPSQQISFSFNAAGQEEAQSALVTPSSIPATPTVSEGESLCKRFVCVCHAWRICQA